MRYGIPIAIWGLALSLVSVALAASPFTGQEQQQSIVKKHM